MIDSERTFFDSELEESSVRRAALTAYITLYKALGGGWSEEKELEEGEEEEAAEEAETDSPAVDEVQTSPAAGDDA